MKDLVQNFPNQLAEAIKIGESSQLRTPHSELRTVLITGLGGSGIGGTIVSEIVSDECSVPVTVNKNYFC